MRGIAWIRPVMALVACTPISTAQPHYSSLASTISSERVSATIHTLAAFGTRHTLSDPASTTRGIGAARAWIKSQLDGMGPNMAARFEEFDAPKLPRIPNGAKLVNVVGVVRGTSTPDDIVYVLAHYDSMCADVMDSKSDAPGANDDASGVAAALEVARVVAAHPLKCTLVVVFTAGEEQGLVGATYRANQAAANHEFIRGVLNNDIIGDPTSPHAGASPHGGSTPRLVRVLSEGLPRDASAEALAKIRLTSAENDSQSRQLARYIAFVAREERTAVQPMLVFRPDRFLRGGDHQPFLDNHFPAVRFAQVDEDYTREHANVTTKDGKPYGDVPDYVDFAYVADVARLNLATAAWLANAPRAPANARIVTAKLDIDTTIRWDASPGAASYEVVWRDTTAPDWQESQGTAAVTEVTLPINKDNFFFGVRAVGGDGLRSPVTFCGAAKE
ncbi:MAG: M20/M25/M40 family metallo-hydrolase [Tepidisphaera sp.]|nr:M20/M25/M40 family metallo-hydrolase [Tepidisphaera sp.]